jgi:hypothetical protein
MIASRQCQGGSNWGILAEPVDVDVTERKSANHFEEVNNYSGLMARRFRGFGN